MLNSRRDRVKKAITLTWVLGFISTGLFFVYYLVSYAKVVHSYENTSLSTSLLSFYGILFGALIVVIALIAPKTKLREDAKRFRLTADLDYLFVVETFTLLLIFANLASYLPVGGKWMEIMVGVQVVWMPWLLFAVFGTLLSLRLYFIEQYDTVTNE